MFASTEVKRLASRRVKNSSKEVGLFGQDNEKRIPQPCL